MSEIKACIFDLDGVLVETSQYHYLAWSRIGKELGVVLDQEANELLKGVSRRRSLEVVLSLGNIEMTDDEKLALEAKKNQWYLEYLDGMTQEDALPMVVPFLEELSQNGLKLAIGSSSRNAVTIINKLELDSYFEAIIDGNQVEHAKPNPEIFLKAAQALGVTPEESVVFEDAISGVEAAKAGNFRCIGVGSPDRLADADLVLSSFEEFSWDKLQNFYQTHLV